MKLNYLYDKEADIFYFSQGKPSAKDISQETSDDVILRLDPKTKKIKGFTILNFNRRAKQKRSAVELPIKIRFSPA